MRRPPENREDRPGAFDHFLHRPPDDVDEELDAHFAGTVDILVERGLDPREAWNEATRRFGDVERYRKRLRRIYRRRRLRGMMNEWVGGIWSGVRFAGRSMRRSPGFVIVVVVLLSLGLGANATMFTIVDRLLLSAPGHITEPENLRLLFIERLGGDGKRSVSGAITWPDVLDLAGLKVFSDVAAWAGGNVLTLGDGGDTEQVNVVIASWRLFPMLGVTAARGRFFVEEEDRIGAPGTVVLSHELWVRRFGGDPDIIGRTLHVGDGRYEVIGVAPQGFTGAELWPVDAWLPLFPGGLAEMGADWPEARGWWWLHAAVRLAPGVSDEVAAGRATTAHRAGRRDVPDYDQEARIVPASIVGARGPDATAEARISRWLAGVSLIVLIIACANVANLLLARSVRCRRELAVRLALGSSRSRLVAHFLTESLALALLAGTCAVIVAVVASGALHRLLLPNVAFGSLLSTRLVGFSILAAGTTALAAGILPALAAGRSDVLPALAGSGTRATAVGGRRLRGALVVAQTALSTVLLVGAALFMVSLDRATETDLGFDPSRLALLRVERGDGVETAEASATTAEIYEGLERTLPGVPGVEGAARTVAVPFGNSYRLPVIVPGLDSVPRLPSGPPSLGAAAPCFFDLMGQSVLRGREFQAADLADGAEPVALVNSAFADHVWGNASDPLSQCIRIGGEGADCARVVGVVANHTLRQIGAEPGMMVWHPLNRGPLGGVYGVLVRTKGPPQDHVAAIRRFTRDRWPSVRFVDAQLLSDPVERGLRAWRLGASLFSIFGLLAGLVAGVGVYSLVAFDVAQRSFEMGIRMALGATGRRLVAAALRGGAVLALLGILMGLGMAALAAPRLGGLLFQTSPLDPLAFGTAALGLLIVSVLASWVPARRATRVDPGSALRTD